MTPPDGDLPANASTKEQFISWSLKQGILAVLILMLIGMVSWVGHYAVTAGIPQVVKQIQDGYEQLDKRHVEQVKAINDQHAAERKEMREDAKADKAAFTQAIKDAAASIDRLSDRVDGRNK